MHKWCSKCAELYDVRVNAAPKTVTWAVEKYWNVDPSHRYCYPCWDEIHYDNLKLNRWGLCECNVCEHNRPIPVRNNVG